MENFQKIIENDIPKITEGLKEEQNEMIEMDNMLNKKITDETQRLVSTIMNEKKGRKVAPLCSINNTLPHTTSLQQKQD